MRPANSWEDQGTRALKGYRDAGACKWLGEPRDKSPKANQGTRALGLGMLAPKRGHVCRQSLIKPLKNPTSWDCTAAGSLLYPFTNADQSHPSDFLHNHILHMQTSNIHLISLCTSFYMCKPVSSANAAAFLGGLEI
eukprot:1142057-Pelagomonas_calceolata.AAC.3